MTRSIGPVRPLAAMLESVPVQLKQSSGHSIHLLGRRNRHAGNSRVDLGHEQAFIA
jgi:hypothetical protein